MARDLNRERRGQTLEELERDVWGPPRIQSHVVTACHALRRKPIGELTVEDLRLLIGQGIGLLFLVPLALEVLERDAFAEGDLFTGDLLWSVLRSSPSHWDRHREHRTRLRAVLERLDFDASPFDEFPPSFQRDFKDAVRVFYALDD